MLKASGTVTALVIALAAPASAQIVVGSGPQERAPKPGLIFCQAHHRSVTYYTDQVWGDRANPDRSPLKQAFADFVRSQYGDLNPEVSCYGDNYAPEPSGGVPGSVWTGFTGGLPTRAPHTAVQRPAPRSSEGVERVPVPNTAAPPKPVEDQSPDVQALNQRILDGHAATAEENQRRKDAHAEAMRQHQQRVAAAEEASRQHQQELARARAAQENYQRELAAHEALVRRNRTQQDRNQLVEWKEAVTVCAFEPDNPQSRLGNWTCHGPLQHTYVKLGDTGTVVTPGGLTNISQACGSSREAVRDLGMVGRHHLFGCSFGLHPSSRQPLYRDQAARFGIEYVPGRISYRCPAHVSYCRTK